MDAFADFRSIVLADRSLQEELDAVTERDEFAALVSRLAQERGVELSAADVLDALRRARQAWLIGMLP